MQDYVHFELYHGADFRRRFSLFYLEWTLSKELHPSNQVRCKNCALPDILKMNPGLICDRQTDQSPDPVSIELLYLFDNKTNETPAEKQIFRPKLFYN